MPTPVMQQLERADSPPESPRRRSRTLRRLRVLSRRHPLVRHLTATASFLIRELPLLILGVSLPLTVFWFYSQHVLSSGPLLLANPATEQLLVVGLIVFLAAFLTRVLMGRHTRRALRKTGQAIVAFRDSPTLASMRSLVEAGHTLDAPELIEPLLRVVDCYRQALAQIAQMQADLEQLGQGTGTTMKPGGQEGRMTTFPFERSRQQMVARLTPNLRWQTATPLLQKILGRTSDRLNGRPFLRFVHPSDRARLEKALVDTLKEGESHNIVFRILPPSPSGEEDPLESPNPAEIEAQPHRYMQADVLTYYDGIGRAEQLRCHFVDVTERVLAEQALRNRTQELMQANERLQTINSDLERLKESYRDLYHHAPIMYFSLDEKGRFAAINDTMLRELGYPRDEILKKSYALVLTDEAKTAHQKDPSRMQQPGEIETRWVGADGRMRDIWIGISTIKDAEGGVARSRCAATDITERNQLAQAVVGRVNDLKQANAELRRINQELEEFTYVVSHDLKEPLRTLEAFSSFLNADYGSRLDDEGREYISHLIAASRRLGKLIDDLLTLSRAGRVIGTARPLDWDAILDTVQADLQMMVTRRPGCVIRIEKPLPAVQGDPERITQLFANLVGNALKYNEQLTPEVVVGATADEGSMATLFVRDNGMGIEPRYHDQIFRIFRRLHRRDEYEGTGAGLAICKKVVEAHGGRIWVESAPGQGSTFFFTLPRVPNRPRGSENAPAAPDGR